jgi:hypothetical protein
VKAFLLVLLLQFGVRSAFCQGQIVFGNIGGGVDAPVVIVGSRVGPGPGWSAQLYLQNAGSLTPLTPTTTFRASGTGAAAIADRYLNSVTVEIPGVQPGNPATFVMRVWQTSLGSYDQAVVNRGESLPFTVVVGGGILPPANLVTLQSFAVGWPEPSTITLGILGGAAFFFFRKRR